jgi:hypothetical protein
MKINMCIIFKNGMSKHSYYNILRPCDIDIEHVLFKKRVSIGEDIYEYPISYQNKPLIIQTPIIYIPYSTYKIDNKITFDFYFSNLNKDPDMVVLRDLIINLDDKVMNKINYRPKIKSGRKRQKQSPKREFISNIKKVRQSCMNEKPDKMRVSLFNTISVFNNLSHPISIDNVKGKTSMKLLLSPTKIWINKNKFGIFWEVLQVKMYPKPKLNSYMFLEGKHPHCTCICECGANRFNVSSMTSSKSKYQCDPRYVVYFDMLKKGVPKQAVINKMIMEHNDPKILEEKRSPSNHLDEYIIVDGANPPPPPPPPPLPQPPLPKPKNSKNSNKYGLEKQPSSNMGVVFNELLGGVKKLKRVSDEDRNKFKRKKRSKTRGSYTPSLDEIVNMRQSLRRQTSSKSRMDYLTIN